MLTQIATLVCAAAMAVSFYVEAASFFHSSPRATVESGSLADPVDDATSEGPEGAARARSPSP